MSTIFRAVFADDRSDLVVESRRLFGLWLAGKGVEADVPTSGRVDLDGAGTAVEVIAAEDGDVEAVRFRLDEEASGQRWSTILTVMAGDGEGWVWIDLERVSDDAYGPPPVLAPPGLVRAFLQSSTCRAGSTVLRAGHRLVDEDGVGELVDELLDPGGPCLSWSRAAIRPTLRRRMCGLRRWPRRWPGWPMCGHWMAPPPVPCRRRSVPTSTSTPARSGRTSPTSRSLTGTPNATASPAGTSSCPMPGMERKWSPAPSWPRRPAGGHRSCSGTGWP